MEKIELNGVKASLITIEHIEIGSFDFGLRGKHVFFGLCRLD